MQIQFGPKEIIFKFSILLLKFATLRKRLIKYKKKSFIEFEHLCQIIIKNFLAPLFEIKTFILSAVKNSAYIIINILRFFPEK